MFLISVNDVLTFLHDLVPLSLPVDGLAEFGFILNMFIRIGLY